MRKLRVLIAAVAAPAVVGGPAVVALTAPIPPTSGASLDDTQWG
ncbi:hypothetical protein [Kitasatospora sp. McL0602]